MIDYQQHFEERDALGMKGYTYVEGNAIKTVFDYCILTTENGQHSYSKDHCKAPVTREEFYSKHYVLKTRYALNNECNSYFRNRDVLLNISFDGVIGDDIKYLRQYIIDKIISILPDKDVLVNNYHRYHDVFHVLNKFYDVIYEDGDTRNLCDVDELRKCLTDKETSEYTFISHDH